MSEYYLVEKPFLDQLVALGWTVIDQGDRHHPFRSLSESARFVPRGMLPDMFRSAVRAINTTEDGRPWLTDRQI